MDDYDKCFEESSISAESSNAAVTQRPIYCYIQSFIKPNTTSDLSNFIQVSKNNNTKYINYIEIIIIYCLLIFKNY